MSRPKVTPREDLEMEDEQRKRSRVAGIARSLRVPGKPFDAFARGYIMGFANAVSVDDGTTHQQLRRMMWGQ